MKFKKLLEKCTTCKLFPILFIIFLLLFVSGCINVLMGDDYICGGNETYTPKYTESWCLHLSRPGKVCYQKENQSLGSRVCRTGWILEE